MTPDDVKCMCRSFPSRRTKCRSPTAGGTEPAWRADGRELFYAMADGHVMAVPVSTSNGFTAGVPEALFRTRFSQTIARGHYLPTADGQRFVVLAAPGRDTVQPTSVVLNWTAGLRR